MTEKQKSDEVFVLEKLRFFSDIHIWPTYNRVDYQAWLSNFDEKELPYAYKLLNFFCFFNNDMVDSLFRAAIHNLSNLYRKYDTEFATWALFFKNIYFTYVSGEIPNPTDSGFLFARRAKKVCNIDELKVLMHDSIFRMEQELKDGYLIFLDDFIGSGIQIYECLMYDLHHPPILKFCRDHNIKMVYCPLVATSKGIANVQKYVPDIEIVPVHILNEKYNIFAPGSLCWDGKDQQRGIEMIECISKRLGIPMNDENDDFYWKGFCSLGLALGFEHSVPDATIPLFRWNRNGWKPLVRI